METKGQQERPGVPKPRLPPLPEHSVISAAREIVVKLQRAGHEAYFVGGFVRDWLLGIEHYDVDVATSAHPEDVERLFEMTRGVGKNFGVMLVLINHVPIEVATYRHDVSYSDFRRPDEVRYGTIEDDAARRDFTINALYYDPVSSVLKDFHAGALDLRRRILRTVGAPAKRFDEDALRLIRAVRFAVGYELEIEQHTRKAIIRKAANLAKISAERVGHELMRILTGPKPGRAVALMSDLGLWAHVIPEIEKLKGVEQGAESHPEGDVFLHLIRVMENLPENPSPALALAALLHDIAKPVTFSRDEQRIHFYEHQHVGAAMAREICRRLKYSTELTEEVADLVENHMKFMHVREMRSSKLQRFLSKPDFQELLELHRADALGSDGNLDSYEFCIEQRKLLAVQHGGEYAPPLLASGDDLIALGLKPGPRFRELLEELRDEQLEGRVNSREQALGFLKQKAEP